MKCFLNENKCMGRLQSLDWASGLDPLTGLVDWTGELDWWTDIKNHFYVSNETHLPVGLHDASY